MELGFCTTATPRLAEFPEVNFGLDHDGGPGGLPLLDWY
jgi:hypothetical protein